MAKKRILIVGDSFCAPGSHARCWYNRLQDYYSVTNVGQPGVGQYKIHQQLVNAYDSHDHVLYLITSPYRVHAEKNPFYPKDHASHANCDLIYEDTRSRLPNVNAQHIAWWFENVFDIEQARHVHKLVIKDDVAKYHNTILVSFFDCGHIDLPYLKFENIWKSHPGDVNHLDFAGHDKVFESLLKKLQQA